MPGILIFGAGGQDASYLAELYREREVPVVGISRAEDGSSADVRSFEVVAELVRRHRPDAIFHLAAESTTAHEALFQNHEVIATGTLNVLEAVRRFRPETRVFLAGSGLQFQNPDGKPLNEASPFAMTSPYAVSRHYSVHLARYFRELGLKVFVGYLFHHESPRRPPRHVSQKIAQAVQRITRGSRERLALGDIRVEKEWGFAGDIARGMVALVEQDREFELVIGTGLAYSIEAWLRACFSLIGKDWREYVDYRIPEVPPPPRLVSDPTRILALGWRPQVGFSELAKLMVRAGQ